MNSKGKYILKTGALLVGGLTVFASQAHAQGGVPLWTNRYHGPGTPNLDDYASALAVNSSGSVFVTRWSYGTNGHPDYATIAYSSGGVPLWTNRYNRQGLAPVGDSGAQALAIDSNGNVIVAGGSTSTNTGYSDWATIAYSSAGVPLWTNRFHGLENGGSAASAAATDNNGNVFVTGSSTITNGYYMP
jgi:hypothetical protein